MNFLTNKNASSFLEKLQFKTICRFDEMCKEVVTSANDVSMFFYEKATNEWLKDNLSGPVFLYQTNDDRRFSMIFLNNNMMVDIKSYKINEMATVDLMLVDSFVKIDRESEYSLALNFKTNVEAENFYNNLVNANKICKSNSDVEMIKVVSVEQKPVMFNASYSNAKTLSLFNDDKINDKFLNIRKAPVQCNAYEKDNCNNQSVAAYAYNNRDYSNYNNNKFSNIRKVPYYQSNQKEQFNNQKPPTKGNNLSWRKM